MVHEPVDIGCYLFHDTGYGGGRRDDIKDHGY